MFKTIPAFIVFCLAVLTGCQANPYKGVTIDTVNKGIVVAAGELRGANLLLRDLVRTNSIRLTDAQRALDHMKQASANLENARVAAASADPLKAQTMLDKMSAALGLAMAILAPLADRVPNADPTGFNAAWSPV